MESQKSQQSQKPQEYLTGSIERVTYHSEESGFCVLRVKVKGHRDLVTLVGNALSVMAGEYVDAVGQWITNREYGLQFQAQELRLVVPSTLAGMEKYLGSGLVKGIGPHFAKRLVQHFGLDVFDIIENQPERLTELSGIGQQRRDRIMQSWFDQKKIREIVVFLHSYGVGTARAVRIYKTYGHKAIDSIRENPYRLAQDIRGIGFKTADALAERLGVSRQSMLRAEAGVNHVLQELCSVGHCAVKLPDLVQEAATLLELPSEQIETAIQQEHKNGRLMLETLEEKTHVFPMGLYQAELGVVEQIKRLMKDPSVWQKQNISVEKSIFWAERETDIVLSKSQKQAVSLALNSKVAIITGGPGVGKTTVVNSILKIIRSFTPNILLCAPTGRAAKRLSESTGLEAKTIHRLLEFDPKNYQFKRQETSPLFADLLVLDEVSMVDLPLMYRLLKAIPQHCGLMLVGDSDQLPSIGPGMVLANLIDSGVIPTVRLTEIFRQAASSKIIVNAHQINKGYIPKLKTEPGEISDFYFVEANTPELIHQKLQQVVTERIPKRFHFNPLKEVQVLVPMNRGGLGVRAFNVELQKALNPHPSQRITRYGTTFSVGDKVIQTVNNYDKDIFNGDIGFISQIDNEESELCIEFENRSLTYELDELDELSLAYATSIHKSQGSEYPAVVIPIAMQHFTLLERNLIYTAVTRGKSLVVIVGQAKALGMAIRTNRSNRRLTHLTQRLSLALESP